MTTNQSLIIIDVRGRFSRLKACTRPAALTILNPRAHRSKDLVWPGESEQELDRASKRANHVSIKWFDWVAPVAVSGPLQGPYRHGCLSPGLTDLRPVRPGVDAIQGRWPCAGHSTCPPDITNPFTRNHHSSIDIEVFMQPWWCFHELVINIIHGPFMGIRVFSFGE